MKTSMISNLSVASALRMTMSQTQKDLMVAQAESISGKHYDMGVALAGKTAQSLDLNREVDRLAALGTSNSLVATRLSASQASLKSMGESGQQILNTILAFGGNQDANSLETSKTSIKNYVNSIMEKANFSNSGEYLFAGINTDVKPLKDIFTDGSADKAAFDAALDLPGKLTTFMAAQTPPVTDKSQLTEAQMTTFLGQVETTFTSDAFWKANVSNASDTNTQSRITQGEVVQTSVNANDQALRKLVLGSIIAQQFMDTSFSAGARIAVQKTAQNEVYQGMNGVSAMQGKLGLSEERVKKANDSIDAQKKIITTYLGDLEGIDVTAAAARVKNLLQLADASYTLTARIQQLSLVNVL